MLSIIGSACFHEHLLTGGAGTVNVVWRNRLDHGAVFNFDRGSNYTSAQFAAKLESLGMRQSVGRTGICYDNDLSESFFELHPEASLLEKRRRNSSHYSDSAGPTSHPGVHQLATTASTPPSATAPSRARAAYWDPPRHHAAGTQ